MPRHVTREPVDARALALDVLLRVDTTDAFADVLLGHRLRDLASAKDRALATLLVYGTLAWRGRLDHHLAALCTTPLDRLDPIVRATLRMGLYQLLFLDRVPAYAAVDGSVRLARRVGRGAAGLVNAVLRRAAADGGSDLHLPPSSDPLTRLAVEYSHPRWLVERWMAEFGSEELPALLATNNQRGGPALRINCLRTGRDALRAELERAGFETADGAFAPDAVVLPRDAGKLRDLPSWRDGRFAFQGEASQLVTLLLGAAPGARVLDACAAPGGKAAYAGTLVGPTGLVVALDIRAGGARGTRAEALRLGATAVQAVVGDARRPPLRTRFDAVLVDAPCSGLGTLRRHPELRWRRRPEDIPRLAVLQRDILTAVAPLVRAGGSLIYAVCTLTREENEDAVLHFVAANPRFVVEPAGPHLPPAATAAVTSEGFLRTLPHRHGLDGFFAARLRARG
jgi:16S rRNA (cytosine967-C5)-methyltransferase